MKEIYLDEKQIEEVVIKYLDNHTYNYALMIDGSWGTGKTFFVKNDLIPLIEKNKKESGFLQIPLSLLYFVNIPLYFFRQTLCSAVSGSIVCPSSALRPIKISSPSAVR